MASVRIWLEATRPKTLPAALCPVLIGTSLAYSDASFDWRPALVCLFFALLVQIGTNFANDYLDGIKGSDSENRIGPRRAVAAGLIRADSMKRAAIFVLATAFCLGLMLIPFGGWWLLLVGASSVVCAWLYTGGPYPLAYNGLGDIFVVVFFGFVAVGFTYFVQAGQVTREVILLGGSCGLVVNNILVVNNFRDYEEDARSGKRTLVVLFGRGWARVQYALSLILAGGVIVWLSSRGYSNWTFLALFPVGFGFWNLLQLSKASNYMQFQTALKRAALVVVGFGLFTSLGIFLS